MPYGNALEMKINDPDVNGLHNKDGNDFTDALIDHLGKKNKLLTIKKIQS